MVARPCLNIVWSSASKTLIFLAVSGALSITYYSPSATAPVGQYSASARHRASTYPYSPWCVEGEFLELRVDGVLGTAIPRALFLLLAGSLALRFTSGAGIHRHAPTDRGGAMRLMRASSL